MTMNWIYKGEPLEEAPEKSYGFVYVITHIKTGKKYIGRKYFTKAGYKTVKGKRKKIRVDSDWRDYWGSSPALAKSIEEEGKENFSREIVRICYSRGETSYWETKLIFEHDAILDGNYYNNWCSCKIQASHVKALLFNQ